MNRANKVTLPTIGLNTERQDHKSKRKFLKGWIMNDTFSNWGKKSYKNFEANSHPSVVLDAGTKEQMTSKSQLGSGITLGQYFRTRNNTENSCFQQTYDVPEQQILPYMRQNFDINEADEDNYEESSTSIRISQNHRLKAKQQLRTENSQKIKIRTECDQQPYSYIAPQNLKTKVTSLNKSKEKMQYIHQMQQSFDLKSKSKSRALSNEIYKKYKAPQSTRKITMIERVKADKIRAMQMKGINVDLMMKYASKFNLDEKSRLQIFRAGN